jgi:hypothetical protein
MFDLGLAPVALSFVGASNKDDLKAIHELWKTRGAEWPAHWLRSRDLTDWGDAWAEKYRERKRFEQSQDLGLRPNPQGGSPP